MSRFIPSPYPSMLLAALFVIPVMACGGPATHPQGHNQDNLFWSSTPEYDPEEANEELVDPMRAITSAFFLRASKD